MDPGIAPGLLACQVFVSLNMKGRYRIESVSAFGFSMLEPHTSRAESAKDVPRS